MSILYSWVSHREFNNLNDSDFQEEYIINSLCEFPEAEVKMVYLFVSSSFFKTQENEEYKVYPERLKSYWNNRYEKELKELCIKHGVDYKDKFEINNESNYNFKSEYYSLNKKYRVNNRKGEIHIKVTKLPDDILENTYSELFFNIFQENKEENERYFMITDKVDPDIKELLTEILFPYKLKRFPRNKQEEKDIKEKFLHSSERTDLSELLDLDLIELLEPEKGPKYFKDILTKDRELNNLKQFAEEIAKTNFPVLILGESGTGKELFAKAIHNTSNRSSKPFFAINCGAIPNELLESELFGHVKGSFTGAVSNKTGLFELAQGGTVFLDEIGEMSIFLQTKLLRAIDNKKIRKVGGIDEIDIDVRFIYATNKDLYGDVKDNKFRADLYYRMSVLDFNIPPLRERAKDDIELIMLKEVLSKHPELNLYKFKKSAKELLYDYDWPGNIRQLKSALIKSLILAKNLKKDIDKEIVEMSIGKKALDDYYKRKKTETNLVNVDYYEQDQQISENEFLPEPNVNINKALLIKGFNLKNLLEKIEKEYIVEALNMDKTQPDAGHRLGYSQQKISRKLKKYNIFKNMF